ncbi:MAG: LysM peptidoglycan-binding domain-containing protein [Anaerolineae bacterium]|nr:LysM peptidoglycan-binding domain-containing protein [Anaerolineae bacterium]MCO5193229.1 LysM peptidoglycan-binding domain-containing protein [Anaerolineae bacterium]MCO5198174.1 LysM peptidoglycan-binding domain-containing protein [Anaerolineae bacterium]MCO5205480.1 LysM peptidoglycan-binding domain-containing protein [Anaerolineae bacterium]
MTSFIRRTAVFLILIAITLSACGGTNNYITEYTLYVAPYTTPCVIDGQSRQCLVVADLPEGPYYTFFNTINGFSYQPGYQYELRVKETVTVSSNGQQTITYDLVQIINQTPVTQPTPSPTPLPTATPPTPGDYTVYTVRPGDTLNEIAVAFNVPRSQIICANNIRNINQIEVGQQLIIPLSGNSCATPIYIVQPGDTLSSIAARFGLSVYELAVYNGIADVNDIEAGDVLYIPAPGTIDSRQ